MRLACPQERLDCLPISEVKGVQAGVHGHETSVALEKSELEYLFEPSAEGVLGSLLPPIMNK